MSDNFTQSTLRRVLQKRKQLQKQLDEILASPASYSIQGAVSQTSQSPDQLRAEIRGCDMAIRRLTGTTSLITKQYVRYTGPNE